MLHIQQHDSIDAFLATCGPLLEQHEAENGLMLGLTLRAKAAQEAGESSPILLISLVEHGQVQGAAIQTPPHNLILSRMREEWLAPLADFVHTQQLEFKGIVGPKQEATSFAQVWEQKTGQETKQEFRQLIYRLDAVQDIRPTTGEMHQATMEDIETVAEWFWKFAEVLPVHERGTPDKHHRKAEERIKRGDIFLWKDQEAFVSMAGVSGPTRNGIRVNAVYTPPQLRGKGYASANVAAMSQLQLDSGREFCFLYTDADFPTSNKIYQDIGYQHVCDAAMYVVNQPSGSQK